MKQHYQRSSLSALPRISALVHLGLCICANIAFAQSIPPPLSPSPVGILPSIASPSQWGDLDSAQQNALHPLQSKWAELSDIQRRKWIAIVKNFPKLRPDEQAKLQERMSAWAALNPQDRERARENFANSKASAPSTKTGSWEEYRALPQEERDKLAFQNNKKRPSAAKSPKPTPNSSAGEAPTTPHPPLAAAEERRDLRNQITPNTLLPRAWLEKIQ